jgi:hypothetical protein
MTVGHYVWRITSNAVSYLSCEFLLEKCHLPNGGAVVFLRSLFVTFVLYLIVIGTKNIVDPETSWAFSSYQLRKQSVDMIAWFGAIFGGAYVTFYTRFASQWTYLANLYNKIKETELRSPVGKNKALQATLAAWKAGFIEDADELHLVRKHMFAFVVKTWGSDKKVATIFEKYTPGGRKRFDRIMLDAEMAICLKEVEYTQ